MPQFIAVITRDLAWVLSLSSSFLFSDLGHVDSGGRGVSVSGFSRIPLVSMLLLLFVLSSLLGRLGIGGSGCGSGGETLRSLGVIPAIYRSLRLDFMGSGMGRLISLETAQICLSHVRTRA